MAKYGIIIRNEQWYAQQVIHCVGFSETRETLKGAEEFKSKFEKKFSGLRYFFKYMSSDENARYYGALEAIEEDKRKNFR